MVNLEYLSDLIPHRLVLQRLNFPVVYRWSFLSLWWLFEYVWQYHHLSGLDIWTDFFFWLPWNCCIHQGVCFCLKEVHLSECPFSFFHCKQVCEGSLFGVASWKDAIFSVLFGFPPSRTFPQGTYYRSAHRPCEQGMPLGPGAFPSCSSQECPQNGSISSTSLFPGRCRDLETILFCVRNQSG